MTHVVAGPERSEANAGTKARVARIGADSGRPREAGGRAVDPWVRHVGLAALLGFSTGLCAVLIVLGLQWWLGRWVMTALVAALLLLLLPAALARALVRYLFAGEEVQELGWLERVGRWWLWGRTTLEGREASSPAAQSPAVESAPGFAEESARGGGWPLALGSRLSRRTVREIMVPRPDIVALPLTATAEEAALKIMESGVSRVPLYRDDLDQVEGFVHAKDVLALLARGERQRPVSEVARPIHFVPESKPLAELLAEMRQGGFHLAMVSDEYGSLVGLVTLEDVIEEVVGQIADEFDREPPEIERLADGRLRVQASVPIVDLNELLGIELPHASWNTVGGLVFGLAGRIPEPGASVELEGVRFTVERVQGRRIVTVLVRPPSPDRS